MALKSHEPASLFERLELSLYAVDTASYTTLNVDRWISSQWIVSHVLQGDVHTETSGIRSHARDGDIKIHPPGIAFSEQASTPGTHQWLAFDLKTAFYQDFLRLYPVGPVVRLQDPIRYARLFQELEMSWQEPASPTCNLLVFSQTMALLGLVIDSWKEAGSVPRPADMTADPDRFAQIVTYMIEHMRERITCSDLAKRAFLHPNYFGRAFRQAYGLSPVQMLREFRLREAQRLLGSTDEPLDAVAAACGLGDSSRLGRSFLARFGVTPGKFRESTKSTSQSYISTLPKQEQNDKISID